MGKGREKDCSKSRKLVIHYIRIIKTVIQFIFLSKWKEVIQPHFPVRLPCYDFTLLTKRTFDSVLLAVKLPASGTSNSDGVTGGVYKARERIHRAMLMRDY